MSGYKHRSINIDDFSDMPIDRAMNAGKAFSPYHFHEGVEILRISKGEANIVINDRTFKVTEGDIIIVNPFEAHGIYLSDIGAEFERTCLVFQPIDLFPAEKSGNLDFFDMLKNICFENIVSHSLSFSHELRACVDSMVALAERRERGWQVAVFGHLVMFYSVMIREDMRRVADNTVPYRLEFMTKVSEFTERNLGRSITTEEIAEHCLYSVEHFCRLFRQCFNRSFKDYLNICRVQKAKDIMDSGDYISIREVGMSVGFNNANHFSNTFKKHMGVSPSGYIKNQKNMGKCDI